MRRPALALLTLAACSGAPEADYGALDDAIRTSVREAGFGGLAVARVEPGRVTWSNTYGFADFDEARPVDAHTPFLVASLSKTVMALLAMQLSEEGVLDLDAPIDAALGFEARHPEHPDTPITARMLLTHTSGLVDDFITLGAATTEGDPTTSLAAFAAAYLADPEHFGATPGTRHDYCNAGFGILGAVIEGATGMSVPALTRARILEPLEMADSGWRLADVDVARVAIPYGGDRHDGLFPQDHEGFAFYPATSFRTSIDDLSRYLATVMNEGRAPNGAAVLDSEATARLLSPQVQDVDADQCLGWYYASFEGGRFLGHSGSANGSSALLFFDPERGVGAALMANSDAFIRARFGDREDRDRLYAIAARIMASP